MTACSQVRTYGCLARDTSVLYSMLDVRHDKMSWDLQWRPEFETWLPFSNLSVDQSNIL